MVLNGGIFILKRKFVSLMAGLKIEEVGKWKGVKSHGPLYVDGHRLCLTVHFEHC